MDKKLVAIGCVTITVAIVGGFSFGFSRPEPVVRTSMPWWLLSQSVRERNGADVALVTVTTLPFPSPNYPTLEVQFRSPKLVASVSAEELKRPQGTHCGILKSCEEIKRLTWLLNQSEAFGITFVKKIEAPNTEFGFDQSRYVYYVKDGKATENFATGLGLPEKI